MPSPSEHPADPTRLAQRVGESLTRLARVTNELTTADTMEAVTKIVTYHLADAVGATIAGLALREGDVIRLIALRGLPVAEAARWETIAMSRPTPPTDVVRTGERMVLAGAAAIRDAYPDLDIERGERTIVVMPLRVSGRTIGAINLSFPGAAPPDRPSSTSSTSSPTRARWPSSGSRPRPWRADRPPAWSSSPRPPSSWPAASTSR